MFNTRVRLDRIDRQSGLDITLEASPDDCADLAERFDWLGVGGVTARLRIITLADGVYEVRGAITADITQACRISGDPVAEDLAVEVVERFCRSNLPQMADIDPMAVSTEVLEGDSIAIGDMIAQLVALEATVWPRSSAITETVFDNHPPDTVKPFMALAEWAKKN